MNFEKRLLEMTEALPLKEKKKRTIVPFNTQVKAAHVLTGLAQLGQSTLRRSPQRAHPLNMAKELIKSFHSYLYVIQLTTL